MNCNTDINTWAIHGVISQAMAQGEEERWMRRTLRNIGIDLTWDEVDNHILEWEQRATIDARSANAKI